VADPEESCFGGGGWLKSFRLKRKELVVVGWLVLERQTNIRTDMATERELDHERIRAACAQVPLIDAHAHNVVALDSNMPFLQCFSEARGHEALSSVPHSLSFQVAFLTYRGHGLAEPWHCSRFFVHA
jgi:hypothetical protein